MMTQKPQTEDTPGPFAVCFCFGNIPVYNFPGWIFLKLVKRANPEAESNNMYRFIDGSGTFSINDSPTSEDAINYLQENIRWKEFGEIVKMSPAFSNMWERKEKESESYSIELHKYIEAEEMFHYTRCDWEIIEGIFGNRKLKLSPPREFNDPFDCGFNEEVFEAYKDKGIMCFSSRKDNTLMYSHYADKHRGMCIGFDKEQLISSMRTPEGLWAEIRPVWYLNRLLGLSLSSEPALCATCKHDDWAYEDEYRLFMIKRENDKQVLQESGLFSFDPKAVKKIFFGLKVNNNFVECVKNYLKQWEIHYYRATKVEDKFGLVIEEI